MYESQIREARDKAGRALQAARDLGKKIAAASAEDVPALDEQFTKARADFDQHMKDVQRYENLEAVEAQGVAWDSTPAPSPVTHRAVSSTAAPDEAQRRKEAHAQAFVTFIRHGEQAAREVLRKVLPAEQHALLSTSGDLGGFLVSEDFRAEVAKDLAGIAAIRPLARVVTCSSNELVFPTVTSATSNSDMYPSGYSGSWKGEGYVTGGTAPTVQNFPKFGQVRIKIHAWQPDANEISRELLEDNAVNLDAVLAEIIAETLAMDEDNAFINGTGVGQPTGLLQSSLSTVNSGSASAVTYGGLVDLFATLPAPYRQNAAWLMSSLTYGEILKLEDTAGNPIIAANTLPGTLWGKPIRFCEWMPEIAGSAVPIIFGNFSYYCIAERAELRVQRLTERYAPNVGILPTARMGGAVLRPNAFRTQTIST